ncbi:MAG: RodZ domain-containing protein [Terriglobales bacterium]
MPSFGEKLKQEREKRKITLEQISVSTKIGTRMLQALEADKFNQLPGGIFNKGFVRAYSRCVGLDEDQTVAEYLEASGEAPPASTEIDVREDRNREGEETARRLESISDSPARQLPWGLFAAVLLVVALALSIWSHRRREHARQSVPPVATTALAPAPSAATGGVSSEVPSETGTAASPSSSSPTTGSPAGGSVPSAIPATPPDSAAIAPAAPGEFTIVIHASQEAWVSIAADGKAISRETLQAGNERAFRGQKEIVVKTGNAGGLDFLLNGKKIDAGGTSGEVRTVTFGPQGILPNAPEPRSTP